MWTYGHALSGFWHYAAQAANRKKEMTRIGAVRFTSPVRCETLFPIIEKSFPVSSVNEVSASRG
jgi:hypothetical protein